MKTKVLTEQNYQNQMEETVVPYLHKCCEERYVEREEGCPIHVMRYRAVRPKGVVILCHGFTENAVKYQEIVYYFVKEHFHVYLPEHCGHGKSYRLTRDPSLVHVDDYPRYVEDFLFIARIAKKETDPLPLYVYGHSMGGGIAAAAAAKAPDLFEKVILNSPMIRPLTGKVPWPDAKRIARIYVRAGKGEHYVVGQKPYSGGETFENSSGTSRERFTYYQEKRAKDPLLQLSAPSYQWLYAAAHLYQDLMRSGGKKTTAPVLLFQAETEKLVSKKAQDRYRRKLSRFHPGTVHLVKVPGSKHEIFNSSGNQLQAYWNMVFAFISCRKTKTVFIRKGNRKV